MSSEFVYAAVNCAGYRPLLLDEQLRYAERSVAELYGTTLTLDRNTVARQIERMLSERRAPRVGNVVHIYIASDGSYTIEHHSSTIYSGYANLAQRARAITERYDLPVEGHRTAISLATADFIKRRAVAQNAHFAIRINSVGNAVSVGDFPLAIVENSRVIFPPETPPCVETDLLKRLCALARVATAIEPIPASRLLEADGAMLFTVSGIQAIAQCNDTLYSHSMCSHLETFLSKLPK